MEYLLLGIFYEYENLNDRDIANFFQIMEVFFQSVGKEMHPTYDTRDMTSHLLDKPWIIEVTHSPYVYRISSNPEVPSRSMVDRHLKRICGEVYPTLRKFLSDSSKSDIKTSLSCTGKVEIENIALASVAYQLHKSNKLPSDLIEPYLATYGLKPDEATTAFEILTRYLRSLGTPKLETFI